MKNKNLFKSRKFWLAVATLAADIIVTLVPELAEVREELVQVITTVGVLLIGTIAAEDVAFWWGAGRR